VYVCDKELGFLFPKARGSGSERYRRKKEGREEEEKVQV